METEKEELRRPLLSAVDEEASLLPTDVKKKHSHISSKSYCRYLCLLILCVLSVGTAFSIDILFRHLKRPPTKAPDEQFFFTLPVGGGMNQFESQ